MGENLVKYEDYKKYRSEIQDMNKISKDNFVQIFSDMRSYNENYLVIEEMLGLDVNDIYREEFFELQKKISLFIAESDDIIKAISKSDLDYKLNDIDLENQLFDIEKLKYYDDMITTFNNNINDLKIMSEFKDSKCIDIKNRLYDKTYKLLNRDLNRYFKNSIIKLQKQRNGLIAIILGKEALKREKIKNLKLKQMLYDYENTQEYQKLTKENNTIMLKDILAEIEYVTKYEMSGKKSNDIMQHENKIVLAINKGLKDNQKQKETVEDIKRQASEIAKERAKESYLNAYYRKQYEEEEEKRKASENIEEIEEDNNAKKNKVKTLNSKTKSNKISAIEKLNMLIKKYGGKEDVEDVEENKEVVEAKTKEKNKNIQKTKAEEEYKFSSLAMIDEKRSIFESNKIAEYLKKENALITRYLKSVGYKVSKNDFKEKTSIIENFDIDENKKEIPKLPASNCVRMLVTGMEKLTKEIKSLEG